MLVYTRLPSALSATALAWGGVLIRIRRTGRRGSSRSQTRTDEPVSTLSSGVPRNRRTLATRVEPSLLKATSTVRVGLVGWPPG